MKKIVILFVLVFFLSSCLPDAETIAGVTKEDLISGKAVEQAFTKACEEQEVPAECQQTLEQAQAREIEDVAYHDFEDLRDSSEAIPSSARVIDGGALEAGVGDKFSVSVDD